MKTQNKLSVRTYALLEKTPESIKFCEHQIQFEGFDPKKTEPGVIWGVYGTRSTRDLNFLNGSNANKIGRRVFQCDLVTLENDTISPATTVSEAASRKSGLLLVRKLELSFKKSLQVRMLHWLQEDHPKDLHCDRLNFLLMVKRWPMLLHRLLKEDQDITTIVHDVVVAGAGKVSIATVRIDPKKIISVKTYLYDQIATTVLNDTY